MRHAEKVDDGTSDPALTAAGESRARALGDRLATIGLDVVYSSQFRRTMHTAQEVARRTGAELRVQELGSGDLVAQTRELARRAVEENRGGEVLIVGHSNTVPILVQALTGTDPGPIADSDYDDLFTVQMPPRGPGRYRVEVYGTATPTPPESAPRVTRQASPPQVPTRPDVQPPVSAGADSALSEDPSKKSVADVIEQVIESRGIETAVRAWMELTKYSRISYDFSEPLLDELGERYTAKGEPLKAMIVLEMNAQAHPESARAFTRLGGAYLALKDRERAAAAYRHALQLDPDYAEAKKALEEIQE